MSDSSTHALVYDASKAQAGAGQFVNASERVIDAQKGVETTTVRVIESQARQMRSVDALARRLDPYGQQVRDATRDLERLTRVSLGQGEAAERAAALMIPAQVRLKEAQSAQTAAMREAQAASRSFGAQTAETSGILQGLSGRLSGVQPLVVAGAAAATAMAVAMKAIATSGDAANAAIARLSATVGSSEQGAAIFEALAASSRQTGISVTDSAAAFQRFSIAAKDVGATSDQVLQLVDGLQKFAIVSGSSMQETAAATQQLGQALASGVLQGDELRSILENMPMFAQALAREMGTSVGSLRALGAEGKLTAEIIFPAMMRAAQGVDEVFGNMPVTMARAQQQFDVATTSFLTSLDKALGFSTRLAAALKTAADLVDRIRRYAGGSTGAERQAELIAGVERQAATVEAYNQAIQDARAGGGDSQAVAMLERTRDDAATELRKFREELAQINKEAVLKGQAEDETAAKNRLAAESAAHAKSAEELKKKYDKQYVIQTEYDEGVKKLEAARNSGAVTETDYLKISTAMLKERDDALAKLTKTEETHRTGVKATKTAVEEQVSAYQKGMDALNKQIEETNQAADAQARITAAYDGTQASLDRVQSQEKAHAAALKAGIVPGMTEYEGTVSRLSDSFNRSSDAAKEFQHVQSSVNAVLDMGVSAADRVGQALIDASFNGAKGFANLGTIAKGVGISMLTDFAKLGLINPITNSFGGQQRDSLWTGVSALTGGGGVGAGGGSGLFGTASNLSTFASMSDAFGLTNFGGQLSGLGETLGLTGSNGLFGGLSGGVSSFLSTPLWSGPAGSLATTAGAEFGTAAGLAAGSPVTLGSLIGGVGLGFGAGSLAGGFVQSAMNKVGPAPTIGAGGGALAGAALGSIVPGVGTLIGGLLGGLLGGAGGGLIGPRPATPFSATGLTTDDNGLLAVGRTFSQIVDTTAEVNALQQQVSALNALLSGSGTRIANAVSSDNYGQARLIGGNSGQWLNFGQGDGRPGDLNAAFGELRFTGENQYVSRGLEGQSFGTAEALQTAVTDILNFVNSTAPALKALVETTPSYGAGTLAATIDGLSRQFDDAKVMAEKLGFAEYDLTEARTKAIQIANDNATKQLTDINRSFLARTTAARGVITGSPQMQLDAALLNFDMAAEQQQEQFKSTLLQTYGDAFAQTQAFADQMAAQETAINAERLASSKSYLDAIAAAEKQSQAEMERAAGTAANAITPIIDYVRNLRFGPESVVPANDRYTAASSQFSEAIAAAQAGDATSVRNLTGFAETFRAASRAQYGSGTQFVTDVGRIVSALEGFAGQSPETLTNAFYASEVRTQTATLGGELKRLVQEVAGLRSDMRNAGSVPASRAA